MPIRDAIHYDAPNGCAGQSIWLRPNPDWCDSGLAPVPAGRSGRSDTNLNQQTSPLLGDPVNFDNLSTKPISVKDLVSQSKSKGKLGHSDDIHDVSVKLKHRLPVRENAKTLPSSSLSSVEKNAVTATPVKHRLARTEVSTAHSVSTSVCPVVKPLATVINNALTCRASLPILSPDVPSRFHVHRQTHAADFHLNLCCSLNLGAFAGSSWVNCLPCVAALFSSLRAAACHCGGNFYQEDATPQTRHAARDGLPNLQCSVLTLRSGMLQFPAPVINLIATNLRHLFLCRHCFKVCLLRRIVAYLSGLFSLPAHFAPVA
jgi:hypothetical protein